MIFRYKTLYFFLIFTVFASNVLILIKAPDNYGFGNLYIALAGVFLTFIGLLFWFLGYIALGMSFSLFPKPKKIVIEGIYKYVKHPIYIGMGLAFVGLSLGKGSLVGLLFTLLITTPLNFLRAKKEEQLLRKIGK